MGKPGRQRRFTPLFAPEPARDNARAGAGTAPRAISFWMLEVAPAVIRPILANALRNITTPPLRALRIALCKAWSLFTLLKDKTV